VLVLWFVNLVLFSCFFLFFGVFRYVYLFILGFGCFLCVGDVVLAGGVGEVFVARVVAGGKVTVPRRLRDVLNLEEGDYVRVTITEVIKRKQEERKGKHRKERTK
jgi:hypothetical protein